MRAEINLRLSPVFGSSKIVFLCQQNVCYNTSLVYVVCYVFFFITKKGKNLTLPTLNYFPFAWPFFCRNIPQWFSLERTLLYASYVFIKTNQLPLQLLSVGDIILCSWFLPTFYPLTLIGTRTKTIPWYSQCLLFSAQGSGLGISSLMPLSTSFPVHTSFHPNFGCARLSFLFAGARPLSVCFLR